VRARFANVPRSRKPNALGVGFPWLSLFRRSCSSLPLLNPCQCLYFSSPCVGVQAHLPTPIAFMARFGGRENPQISSKCPYRSRRAVVMGSSAGPASGRSAASGRPRGVSPRRAQHLSFRDVREKWCVKNRRGVGFLLVASFFAHRSRAAPRETNSWACPDTGDDPGRTSRTLRFPGRRVTRHAQRSCALVSVRPFEAAFSGAERALERGPPMLTETFDQTKARAEGRRRR
jgi:hypothetical protein